MVDELVGDGIVSMEDMGYVGEGKFVSPLPEYPGSFTLAHPFYGQNYKAWLRATREEFDDKIEGLTVFTEWRGFVAILVEWKIDDIPFVDVTPDGDSVPEKLKYWCRTCMVEYLAEQYDPKAWLGPQETTS